MPIETGPGGAVVSGMPSGPYGHPDCFSVYINEVEYIETEYIKVVQTINQLDSFELRIYDINSSDPNVAYGNTVKIFAEAKLLLKGKIQEVRYSTDNVATVKGYGMAIGIANKEYSKRSGTLTNTTPNLVNVFLSLNNNSASPWIMNAGTVEDFGIALDFRAEFDNKLQILNQLAKMIEWDWYVSNGDPPYNDDRFNLVSWRGSLAPVYTVYLSGSNQNGIVTMRNDNFRNLTNSIVYLGRGEGTDQLWTQYTLATTVYDSLQDNMVISAGVPGIWVVETGKGFPTTAAICIQGRFASAYTQKAGNVFAGDPVMDTEDSGLTEYTLYKGSLCILLYDGTGKNRTQLVVAIEADDDAILVENASGFPSSGSLIISREVIDYTGIDGGDTFVGCTRGRQGTTAVGHGEDVYVFEYDSTKHYTAQSPQAGSSVAVNGLKEVTITDPTKESEPQIHLEASNFLKRNASITYDITFEMMDYFEFFNNVNLGDRIQIVDTETGLNNYFRVIGIELAYSGYGETQLLITASNKKITETTFIDSLGGTNRLIQSRLTYAPT